jgi:hypothetical protein
MMMYGVEMMMYGVEMIVYGVEMIVYGVEMIVYGVEMIVYGVEMRQCQVFCVNSFFKDSVRHGIDSVRIQTALGSAHAGVYRDTSSVEREILGGAREALIDMRLHGRTGFKARAARAY